MTLSSSGLATGRALSWTFRVKKSVQIGKFRVSNQVGSNTGGKRSDLLTIPGLVSIVLGRGVTDVHILKLHVGLVGCIRDLHDVTETGFAEPALRVVSQHLGRLGRLSIEEGLHQYFTILYLLKPSFSVLCVPARTCPIRSTPS